MSRTAGHLFIRTTRSLLKRLAESFRIMVEITDNHKPAECTPGEEDCLSEIVYCTH